MKTSNKILISFLIFLFCGITLLFIASKYCKGIYDKSNYTKLEKPLIPFSVVVAEPGANFVLKNGKKNKIIQYSLKNLDPNFASYEVRNDTLFVYAVKKDKSKNSHFIYVPEIYCTQLKSIVGKKDSKIRMNNFKSSSLQIIINNAHFEAWRSDFTSVVLQAVDSNIRAVDSKTENIKFELNKSILELDLKKKINSLSGTLKNKSEGKFWKSSFNVNLSTDKSSAYHFYN